MRALLLGVFVACSVLPAAEQTDLIALARAAVRAEVEHKSPPKPARKSAVKAVFVTVEVGSRVVGCRGSLETRTRSLEEEVILAARAAAAHDPRHRPLTPGDLRDFLVTVTIVERVEHIESVDLLQPSDGLVLKANAKTGVVLPWEGKDPKVRLAWAYKKAGVKQGAACRLSRMTAERIRG